MQRPKRYEVEWESPELLKREVERVGNPDLVEQGNIFECREFATLGLAKAFFNRTARIHGGALRERYNITDVTPDGDPPDSLWDYAERIIEEA